MVLWDVLKVVACEESAVADPYLNKISGGGGWPVRLAYLKLCKHKTISTQKMSQSRLGSVPDKCRLLLSF